MQKLRKARIAAGTASQMKKRLLVIDQSDFQNIPVGGSTTFLRTVVPNLCQHFEVSLLGRSNDLSLHGRWTGNYLGSARFFAYGGLTSSSLIPGRIKTLFYLSRALKQIELENFDYLYFHQVETAIPFLKRLQVKKILHLHGLANPLSVSRFPLLRNGVFQSIYNAVFRYVKSHIDCVVSVSCPSGGPNELVITRQDNFHYVPVCVDKERFVPLNKIACRKLINLPPSGIVFGYIGRLSKSKCVNRSIEFIRHLVDQGQDVRMIIVGDGEVRSDLSMLAETLSIADRIHFFPACEYEDLPEFYSAIEIFLMASEAEGFPMVVLEALSCGVPILSTDVGAISTVVKDDVNGFIVSDFSPRGLAYKSGILLSGYASYSKEAVNSTMDYSADRIAAKIAQIILSCPGLADVEESTEAVSAGNSVR